MAQQTVIHLVDDIDGEPAEETVSFSMDGVSYEIDLTQGNAAKLRAGFEPFVRAARRTGGRRVVRSVDSDRREALAQVRQWARAKGYTVSDRGRIATEIQRAYDAAHRH